MPYKAVTTLKLFVWASKRLAMQLGVTVASPQMQILLLCYRKMQKESDFVPGWAYMSHDKRSVLPVDAGGVGH